MFNLFKNKFIGLDISDRTIEVAEILDNQILNLGRVEFSGGIVEKGKIKNEEKLSELVKKVLKEAMPESIKGGKVVFGLAESQAYTIVVDIKQFFKKEIKEIILKQVQKNIPLENPIYSYKILSQDQGGAKVLIFGADKKVISEWKKFFNKIKIEVEFFDAEVLANFRSIFGQKINDPVCVVDIGLRTTDIAIFKKEGLSYSETFAVAGENFTKKIAAEFKINYSDAEKQKLKADLNFESEIASLLKKGFEEIVQEVKISLDYWQNKNGQKIKEIILIGGSSKIKGAAEYFSKNLGISARVGSSFLAGENAGILYLGAIGLALRGKKEYKDDPALNIKSEFKSNKASGKIIITSLIDKEIKQPEDILDQKKGTKKKIIILSLILISGIIFIFLAFWFRSLRYSKLAQERKKIQEKFAVQENINYFTVNDLEEDLQENIYATSTEEIQKASTTEDVLIEKEKIYLLIQDTPTGYLNVRSGPGTDYKIVTRIKPGEGYPMLGEESGWFNIYVSSTTQGWIFGRYALKFDSVDNLNQGEF